MKFIHLQVFAVLSLFFTTVSSAQAASDDDMASKILAQHESGPSIRSLNWLNQNYMDKQRSTVNGLLSTYFGKRLQGDKRDLSSLQRIVNEELITRVNTQDLQALGVALGDVFISENSLFEWVIYEDDVGSTQAVCVKSTKHCLFPITMLSRRMEVGLKPSVNRIFNASLEEMQPYLPKTPYSVK